MVSGLPQIHGDDKLCERCIFWKQHREPFPKGTTRQASTPIEFVHADVYRPMWIPSLSNNTNFIVFIDYYSRFTWVYFAKEKYEALPIFKKFKSCVEKQSGQSLKIPRTDQDGEFFHMNSIIFVQILEFWGNYTASYTPQQNSVAERRNRSLV